MKDWRQTIRIRDLVFERVQVNEPLNCTNVYLGEFNQPFVTVYLHLHLVYITPIIKLLYIMGKRCIVNWQTLEWAFG